MPCPRAPRQKTRPIWRRARNCRTGTRSPNSYADCFRRRSAESSGQGSTFAADDCTTDSGRDLVPGSLTSFQSGSSASHASYRAVSPCQVVPPSTKGSIARVYEVVKDSFVVGSRARAMIDPHRCRLWRLGAAARLPRCLPRTNSEGVEAPARVQALLRS